MRQDDLPERLPARPGVLHQEILPRVRRQPADGDNLRLELVHIAEDGYLWLALRQPSLQGIRPLPHFARFRVGDRDGVSGIIHKQLLPSFVVLHHRWSTCFG